MLTTESVLDSANRLRPLLLQLNRELRRELAPLGITGGQAALLHRSSTKPGIGVRDLAAHEGVSAPAMCRLRRPARGRRARHARALARATAAGSGSSSPTRAARLLRSARSRRTAWLAGARGSGSTRRSSPRSRPRVPALARCLDGGRVTAALLRANRRTFASLRKHRNYRLFFAGQVMSVSGTWMQNIATAWLVLELTHSPVAVGVLALCQFLPFTVFGLFARRARRPLRRPPPGDRTQARRDAARRRARRPDPARRS